jgi:hypothetical protein
MKSPADAKVNSEALDDFLSKAARLTAEELVADRPRDLKRYGLESPAVRWRFQLDGKDVLDLLVGNVDPAGRCYAKLAAGTLVFLLKKDMTPRVLGEFRDRTLWESPPDASRVDLLRLTRDGKTVELTRTGMTWQVVGKPDVRLRPETVDDTLAALAGLKIDHYAVDRDAQKKRFGLDPPELVIEAEADGKKAVLNVGRFEGESKRAYASVPGKDRSEVVVLSEADTARLTRDLDALTRPLPKPR